MELYARGWRRNMGRNRIASIDLGNIREADWVETTVQWQEKTLQRGYDDISISWGDKLQLTGEYLLKLVIQKDEILRLFKLTYGSKFQREELDNLGFTVTGAKPTEKELEEATANIKLSQFISMITAQINRGPPEGGRNLPLEDCVDPNLLRKINDLDFSVPTAQCLRDSSILYIGQLVQRTEGQILRIPKFGRKSLNEVKWKLATMGLSLRLQITNPKLDPQASSPTPN